jgi:hypothetical protein
MENVSGHFRSNVPAGSLGKWAIERGKTGTILRERAFIWMTDDMDEWEAQRPAVREAIKRGGDVLVTGLGIGYVIEDILGAASNVRSITVIEWDKDIISLVAPYIRGRFGDRVRILNHDAMKWSPKGHRFSVAWHDIWPLHKGAEDSIRALQTRYSPWCAWQGSWPEFFRKGTEHGNRG